MRWLLFFTSGFFIIYHYLLYPATAILLSRRKVVSLPAPTSEDNDALPPVTLLIAAYNEGKVIRNTLERIQMSNYGNYEVIIIDDGSTDNIDD